MERLFFSKENFNIIYNILHKKILNNMNFNINSDESCRKEIINIIKAIYQQRSTFHIPSNLSDIDTSRYLSQKVINVASRYFKDSIEQKNSKASTDHLSREMNSVNINNVNKLDTRPESTHLRYINDKQDNNNFNRNSNENPVNTKYDMAIKERQPDTPRFQKPINFKDSVEVTNNDVRKKYEELNNTRLNEYESVQQNSSSSQLNLPDQLSTQNNYISSPSPELIRQQFRQEQQAQKDMNSFQIKNNQPNINQADMQYTHPSQIPLQNQQFQQRLSQPEANENTNPLNNELTKHFDSFIDDNQLDINIVPKKSTTDPSVDESVPNDMSPDENIDYTNIFSEMNTTDNVTVDDQYSTPVIENTNSQTESNTQFFPNNVIDNKTTPSNIPVRNSDYNEELTIIRDSLERQSTDLANTHSKIDSLVDMFNKQDISKFYQSIMDIPRLISSQQKQPLTTTTHNLIISSKDRDLGNTLFDKYNFKVVFGAGGDETDSSGTVFKSSALNNPTIQHVFKNVVSVKLKRVIIPRPRKYTPEPYLFISIDEFNSNIVSSKTFTDKIFCKVNFDKEVTFGVNNTSHPDTDKRSYIYYINDDNDIAEFTSPLAKLDRLTLKILTSEGNSLSTSFRDNDHCIANKMGDEIVTADHLVQNGLFNNFSNNDIRAPSDTPPVLLNQVYMRRPSGDNIDGTALTNGSYFIPGFPGCPMTLVRSVVVPKKFYNNIYPEDKIYYKDPTTQQTVRVSETSNSLSLYGIDNDGKTGDTASHFTNRNPSTKIIDIANDNWRRTDTSDNICRITLKDKHDTYLKSPHDVKNLLNNDSSNNSIIYKKGWKWDTDASNNLSGVYTTYTDVSDMTLINISNQVEFVFEVKTLEPESNIRSII